MASDLALWMAVWDKLGMLSPSHPFHQAWHVVVEQEKVADFPYSPWAEVLEQTTEDNKRFLGQAESWQDAIVLQSRARTAPYQTVLKPGCGLVSPLRSRAGPEGPDPTITSLQIGCGPWITFHNHTQCAPEDMWRETTQDAVVLDVPSSYIAPLRTNHNPLVVALLIVLSLAVLLLASLGILTIVCWISSLLPKSKSRITVWSHGAIQVKPGNDDAVDVLKESSVSQSRIITMQSTESQDNIDRAIQPPTRSKLSMSGDTLQSIDGQDDADTEAVEKEQESMVILQDTVNKQNNLIRDKDDRIDKLLDEVQRLNTKVANQSRHLKEMEQSRTLKNKKDECERLQKAVETAEERITDLEGQISDGQIEYQKLKSELDEAKEQIQKIGENMEEEVKEKNDLQAAKGLLSKALSDARKDNEQLHRSADTHRKDLQDWKAARNNLERDLSLAKTELREQQKLANVTEQTLQKEKTRLQPALEYSNLQLQQANAERDKLQTEANNAKAEKDRLRKDLNEANSRVEEGETGIDLTHAEPGER
jgi:predicted  nucleic acid-binding Zn-ribbon protein